MSSPPGSGGLGGLPPADSAEVFTLVREVYGRRPTAKGPAEEEPGVAA